MIVKSLELSNFKNYSQARLQFSPRINCLFGPNAAGKTNILDALYYLSFCKSYFNPLDNQNIRRGEEYFRLCAQYTKNGRPSADKLELTLKKQQKKQLKKNGKEYQRFSDHIGLYPLVMISPDDTSLISGGSEVRRKFIDGILAQFNSTYLSQLIQYQRALQQRNALLKKFREQNNYDPVSMDIWDQKLISLAPEIHACRKQFLKNFNPTFEKLFHHIAGSKEKPTFRYESQLNHNTMEDLLKNGNQKDQILKYTGAGVHKDDYIFQIDGLPLKKFASQGQQKSFVVAAKLAQFQYMKEIKGYNPIILLDDIFDRLDENRTERIMELVSENTFGQIFITDTQPQRIMNTMENINAEKSFFKVHNGTIK